MISYMFLESEIQNDPGFDFLADVVSKPLLNLPLYWLVHRDPYHGSLVHYKSTKKMGSIIPYLNYMSRGPWSLT